MYKYKIPDFLGGINRGLDESFIERNQAYDLSNIDNLNGTLRRCKGYQKVSTAGLTGRIMSLMPFYRTNGQRELLCATNDGIYKLDNGTWTKLKATTNGSFDYINYQFSSVDYLIMTNGTDYPMKYDGTSVTTLKNAPKGKYIDLHYERVWITGGTNINRVHFSKDMDPEIWTEELQAGFVDKPTFDGEGITGIKTFMDKPFILKRNALFYIYGTTPTEYYIGEAYGSKGTVNNDTVQDCMNAILFLGDDGIYSFNGTTIENISNNIKPYLEGITDVSKVKAVYFDNKYIISIPYQSIENNLVFEYSFLTGNWTKKDIQATCFAKYDGELYFGDINGNVYKFDDSDTFAGKDINSYWQTGYTDLGYPDQVKDLEMAYLSMKGDGAFFIEVNIDKKTVVREVRPQSTFSIIPIRIKGRGRILNVKLYNSSGSPFEVKHFLLKFDVEED